MIRPAFHVIFGLLLLISLAVPAVLFSEMGNAPTHRVLPTAPIVSSGEGFSLRPASASGIKFTNHLSLSRYTTNQIYLNGSGVAAGDVDGDGWCDLYFCNLDGGNVLYKNLGDWTFTNITQSAGVACAELSSTGAAFADLDGDGDLDLIVNSIGGGTQIFLNDGRAHFTRKAILNEGKGGMSLALADIDSDGDLDLYICNYRTSTLRDMPQTNFRVNMVDGKPVVAFVNGEPTTLAKLEGRYSLGPTGNIAEAGEVDALFKNDGKAGFTLMPFTGGNFFDEHGAPVTSPPYDWSLSAMFHDLNGDGFPDLYVCSDFDSPDRIWMNQGDGKFKAISPLALRNSSKFSMGVDIADIDRDGHDDIFVLDMLSRDPVIRLTRADKSMDATPPGVVDYKPQFTRNTLHRNRGDGTYAEIAYFAGLEASEWAWTPVFMDIDLDGFEDLLVTSGHGRDDMDIDNGLRIERTRRTRKMTPAAELMLRQTSPALPGPKMAFRNSGQLRFEDKSAQWHFNQIGISHGMCLADLDNDGDLDIVVNNLNAAAGLYRNECSAPRIAIRLHGNGANTRGIGARIKVTGGAVPLQTQEIISGGRYLSSDDAVRVFAVGTATNEMGVEVMWPGGKVTTLRGLKKNQRYEIFETTALSEVKLASTNRPLFENVSAALDHRHQDEPFDDFSRQALLPNRLSQLGPGVSWTDIDGDGREDLVIGSGRGGKLSIFHNEGSGGFSAVDHSVLRLPVTRDITGIVGYSETNGRPVLIIASSNYEDGSTNGSSLREYDFVSGKTRDLLPAQVSSASGLALADIDGDGDLDLFVGGRVMAVRYPEPASSLILLSENGQWKLDAANGSLLQDIGLVSGAIWTDLNSDGFPELVLACEWGSIRIFDSDKGRLKDATRKYGLEKKIGFWNGVAAGDFDGDGRMDLIASNWGLNSKYRVSGNRGPRIYFKNWGGAGEIEPIEASFDFGTGSWRPERDLNSVGRAIPIIREKFRTHRSFAEATLDQIFGETLKDASVLEANWLETTVFLNRGDHFELGQLPSATQFAPAFGINVADFDGDGHEDVFLSQNFFAVQPQSSRNDAGLGLLLKGRGTGAFDAFGPGESGIRIYGEQRGSATADYDADGRVDLVVSQNSAATTLWHNISARPGLRVRLQGNGENGQGIGALIRLEFDDHWGPVREVRAGSGYWSQDSALQVLATPSPPIRIQVIWPGGSTTTYPLPQHAKEVTVSRRAGVVISK